MEALRFCRLYIELATRIADLAFHPGTVAAVIEPHGGLMKY